MFPNKGLFCVVYVPQSAKASQKCGLILRQPILKRKHRVRMSYPLRPLPLAPVILNLPWTGGTHRSGARSGK